MTGTTPGCVPTGDLAPAAGLLDISSEDMCEAQLGEEAKERAWTTPGVPRLHSGNRLPSPRLPKHYCLQMSRGAAPSQYRRQENHGVRGEVAG